MIKIYIFAWGLALLSAATSRAKDRNLYRDSGDALRFQRNRV